MISRVRWSKKDFLILKEMYPSCKAKEIAKKLNRTESAINCMAQLLGIKKVVGNAVSITKVKSGSFMVYFASKYLGCFKDERLALQVISERKEKLNK